MTRFEGQRWRVRFARLEMLALLFGAAVALVAFAALRGGSHSDRGYVSDGLTAPKREPLKAVSRVAPPGAQRTAAGVVRASTTDLAALASATVEGPSRSHAVVEAATIGPLQSQLQRAFGAAAARIERRLWRSNAAQLFVGWPLGFRVVRFDRSRATVAIWHLDMGASSALGLMDAQYTTTTYGLRWAGGGWRIAAVTSVPGPTPPAARAPPAEIDEFAREIDGLSRYRYVP